MTKSSLLVLAASIVLFSIGFPLMAGSKSADSPAAKTPARSITKADPVKQLQATVDLLRARIEELEKKVRELEDRNRLRLIPAAG